MGGPKVSDHIYFGLIQNETMKPNSGINNGKYCTHLQNVGFNVGIRQIVWI